jgi:hypothetical protein
MNVSGQAASEDGARIPLKRQPQYRLRVNDIRVFYDVTETQVQILAIVTKEQAQAWLDEQATREDDAEGGGTGGSEG